MAKVPYTKTALNYPNQLQQLKDRGLRVEDDNRALHLLEKISYYRLSGYWFPMLQMPKSAHQFKPESSFDNAFRIYCFDRELRKLVSNEIEKIEVAIRAKMIYILSHTHGPFWYTNVALFSNPTSHNDTKAKLNAAFNRTDELYIQNFKRKYSDPFPPCWMMFELASFGNISKLYENLAITHEKRQIAHEFGLDDSTFESWIHSLAYVRNLCAHHSRLWNRIMSISPQIPLTPTNSWINITTVPSRSGLTAVNINNRTYFMLSVILYLLNTINPNNNFKLKLKKLFYQYPNIDFKALGFPLGWENEPLWNWSNVKFPFYKKLLMKLA